MKAITRRGYTFDREARDYYRVDGDTSMLTDARSIVFFAMTHWMGREYAYFDLDDRKSKEYNILAAKRRRTKIVRRDRYHYYNI